MTDTVPVPVADLVDQNCHGVLRTELGLGTFEARLGAARAPAAPGTTFFDTQTGFAVRRWCPPLLGLEAHCPPAHYLARRRELGVVETSRRLLRAAGVSAHLVDTGLPGDLTGPAEMASAAGSDAREIVRLEVLAEHVADTSGTVDTFLVNLGEAVHTAASSAVAFTSVGAAPYAAPEPPGPVRVRAAAGRWLALREEARTAARRGAADREGGGAPVEPELLDHLRWSAVACGLPLQLRLGAADPGGLADFAAATEGHGCDLVLLHGYPYHRQTAALVEAVTRTSTRTSGPSRRGRGRGRRPCSRRSWSWRRSASCCSPPGRRPCRNCTWWAPGSSARRWGGCWAPGSRTARGPGRTRPGSPR